MVKEQTLPEELSCEIRERVFGDGFIRLTQSLTREGVPFRISLRPVRLKGERFFQAEMCDDGRTQVRNLSEQAARKGLEDILRQPGKRDLHIISTLGDLHVRVTKKGKPLVSRGKPKATTTAEAPVIQEGHDHVKKQPLTSFDATPLLRVLGLADSRGQIKPSMRGKYDQVNALLRAVEPLLPEKVPTKFTVIDCGCGKAYLTLALHRYLVCAKGWPQVQIVGVDKNESVVTSAREMANALGVGDDVTFQACTIDAATLPQEPDLVMSLHACDTATADALIAAVKT
ncbi:MAG: methyltransferase, partial [Kiritimatiellae bacterium]|nr:methyltransferase [Kiritimatiellia bacterium]